MTYAEFQERQERAAQAEFDQLSNLTSTALMEQIREGRFGEYLQAFAALASKRDVALAAPFLAQQLSALKSYPVRLSCAHALLDLLPYSGIPAHSLADPRHPGHSIYTSDLQEHLQATLEKLKRRLPNQL